MKALLIIDMQNTCFKPETPRYEADKVMDRINILSRRFRSRGNPVIFIQHDGTDAGYCFPGTEEWQVVDQLESDPKDLHISKKANDSFYNSPLKEELDRNHIDEVVITGCATDFCVDATLKSALVNDFNVTVISDGHTTADRPGLTAKQVIEHYNWVWSEMFPTKGFIRVVAMNAFLGMLD